MTAEKQNYPSELPGLVAPRVQAFLLRHSPRTENRNATDAEHATLSTFFLQGTTGRIAYSLIGAGPLVICIQSLNEVCSVYRFLSAALAEAGFQVAAVDLRGHGHASAAPDIIALAKLLGGPAILVGIATGTAAACWAAAEEPTLVSGLVLFSPRVRTLEANLFRMLATRLTAMQRWLLHRSAEKKPGKAEACLLNAHVPTLIVMGDQDTDFIDPAGEAHRIAKQLHGQVLMVSGAGHYPLAEFPEVVAPIVVRFVQQITPCIP